MNRYFAKMKGERGFSMVSVIFVVLMLGAIGLTMSPLVSGRARASTEDLLGQEAFYVTDGGLQFVLAKEFMNSTNFTTAATYTNKPLGPGTFTVTYPNGCLALSCLVQVTGTVGTGVRSVQEQITETFSSSGAMQAGGSVSMTASQSGGGSVTGVITYGTTASVDTACGDGACYTISSSPVVGPAPNAVNMATLTDITTTVVTTDQTISGNFTGFLWVKGGNVTINGSGTITGVIVATKEGSPAKGNVTVNVGMGENRIVNGALGGEQDMSISFQQTSAGTFIAQNMSGVKPLLLAGGNITIDAFQTTGTTFSGLIKAGGNVDLKSRQSNTLAISGAVVAGGDITTDSKQSSLLSISYPADPSANMPMQLTSTSWKEV